MNETVIVTGVAGQDGYYLAKELLEKGYTVVGLDQWQYKGYSKGIVEHMENKNFTLIEGDITDRYLIRKLLTEHKPKFFINAAAISHVAISFKIPERTTQVNYVAVLNMLQEILAISPGTKFLQCSTSEQFGDNKELPQNENSAMLPNSPYAIAKMAAFRLTKLYRNYGLKTYNTIAFNHESSHRPENFVTRKITKHLTNIKKNKTSIPLELGNLDAYRDWGYAPDYTGAMIKMLESNVCEDYVLATGETHTVREFIEETCNVLGWDIKWTGKGLEEQGFVDNKLVVKINPDFYRPAEVDKLCGDASKIKAMLGWEPNTTFKELVNRMVKHDLKK